MPGPAEHVLGEPFEVLVGGPREPLGVRGGGGRARMRHGGGDRVVELVEHDVERHVGVPQAGVAGGLGLGEADARHAVGGGDDPHVQRRPDDHPGAADVLDERERAALGDDRDVDAARRPRDPLVVLDRVVPGGGAGEQQSHRPVT